MSTKHSQINRFSSLSRKKQKTEKYTFAVLQIEHSEASKPIGNNKEIGVDNTREKGAGSGLREVELHNPREPRGHLAEHVDSGPYGEPLPLRALQVQPFLADQAERLLVLVAPKPRQNQSYLVVRQDFVYADAGSHGLLAESQIPIPNTDLGRLG